jgi:hypothetical protein
MMLSLGRPWPLCCGSRLRRNDRCDEGEEAAGLNNATAPVEAKPTPPVVPPDPPPWDDLYLPESARWLHTIRDLLVEPTSFFRRVATDRLGGVLHLAAVSTMAAVFSLSSIVTAALLSMGSGLSPAVVFVEVMLATLVLGSLGVVGYVGSVAWLSHRSRRHLSRLGWVRIACFAGTPWLLALLPGLGVPLAWFFSSRAWVAALTTKLSLSATRAWVVVLTPWVGAASLVVLATFWLGR